MVQNYEKIEIQKGVNLIIVKTDKFKTNLVSVYIKRPLNREEATKNALLPYVLKCGSKNYKSQVEISKKLDELYGSNLVAGVGKKGEKHILSFKLVMTNDRYIDEAIFEDGLMFMKDMIFDPLLEEGAFSRGYFDVEAQNLRDAIRGRVNDKAYYAVERCVEEMCKGENYSIHEDGYEEDIEKITPQNLYSHYRELIGTSPIDMLVVGDIDSKRAEAAARSFFEGVLEKDRELIAIPEEQVYNIPAEVKNITESMDITQGKLCMGFRTNIHYLDPEYYPLAVYASVLGGGPHSKMFLNIREKESLCYYIYASVEKYKGLMLISSGIEFENYEKALELIRKELSDMSAGSITQLEMDNSKSAMTNSIRSMADSINGLSEFYYGQLVSGVFETPEEMIEKISSVSVEDVVRASEKIKMDTIYFLKN